MTKINLFTHTLFLLIAIIFGAILQCWSAETRIQRCYDEKCSEPISHARTVLPYNTNNHQLLSVKANKHVIVYSKEIPPKTDTSSHRRAELWWGVEVDGVRGYVPEMMLKESKVIKKNLTFEVPMEKATNTKSKMNNIQDETKKDKQDVEFKHDKSSSDNGALPTKDNTEQSSVLPDHITSSFEIIDGTTIPVEDAEVTIRPSAATQNMSPTAMFNISQVDSDTAKVASEELLIENHEAVVDSSENKDSNASSVSIKDVVYDSTTTINTDNKSAMSIEESFDTNMNLLKDQSENDVNVANNTFNLSEKKLGNSLSNELNATHNSKSDQGMMAVLEEKQNVQQNSSDQEAANIDTNTNVLSQSSLTVSDINQTENILDSTMADQQEDETSNQSVDNMKQEEKTIDIYNHVVESGENKINQEAVVDTELAEDTTVITQNTAKNEQMHESIEADNIEDDNTEREQRLNQSSATHIPETSNLSIAPLEKFEKKPPSPEVPFISQQDDNTATLNYEIENTKEPSTVSDHEQQQKNWKSEETDNTDGAANNRAAAFISDMNDNVNNIVHTNDNIINDKSSVDVPIESTVVFSSEHKPTFDNQADLLHSSQNTVISEQISNFKEFPNNRNLLNVKENLETNANLQMDKSLQDENETFLGYGDNINDDNKVLNEAEQDHITILENTEAENVFQVTSIDTCTMDCDHISKRENNDLSNFGEDSETEQSDLISTVKLEHNYWETLTYLGITAFTSLLFSLGYYYIENVRRDGQLIAKINKLEKDLLVSMKESMMVQDQLKSAKEKLTSIQDESFGSNEMVLSLKADLEGSQNLKAELEDQVAMLEKDLESATEAGLELERMLREVLSSNNEVNPLAQSVEDLQTRLNAQHEANESLTNALNLKSQECETLSANLASTKTKYEDIATEVIQLTENLKAEIDRKNYLEKTLNSRVQQLEDQLNETSTEKQTVYKELKNKEAEVNDLVEVINQVNSNSLDLTKLYDVSRIKADAAQLLEERNELKVRLSEIEGAHHLLEEHTKLVQEEISVLSDQCKIAEKEKKDAETRLEVLTNFFNEKEVQRQKEETIWLQKQGEVVSTVERMHTMQNEIQSYKQQIEMLKREIIDQEREYKSQISGLETKAHEQWVTTRQNERRLEEAKAEAGQLRNRLTLIEKNINDVDPDAKLHRLEANGETTTALPPLFIGAESSNSPIMFTGSSGVPPPRPPSFMHCSLFPPYLPPPLPSGSGVPPYDVGQRPPPLGGRLSSPPPMHVHPPPSSRYDNAASPPPAMSPRMLPPFNRHRSPPPPFTSDHIHPPPPPPPGAMLPPLGTTHSWGEETLPPLRNSGYHPHPREQRIRNHKGSLHSSGESLDKTHGGKV